MAEHHAFGLARGAAGELENGRILRPHLYFWRLGPKFTQPAPPQKVGAEAGVGRLVGAALGGQQAGGQLFGRRQIIVGAGVDDVADAALGFDLNGRFAKSAQRHQNLCPRRIRLPHQLFRRVQRIGHHHNRPDAQRAVVRYHQMGHVGQQNHDPRALFAAQREQPVGKTGRLGAERTVAEAAPHKANGGPVRKATIRPIQ